MLLSTRHVLGILVFLSLNLSQITYARRYFRIAGSSPHVLVADRSARRPTLRSAAATCCFSYCNNSRRRCESAHQIFRRISATMGPVHASKSASSKMERIRSILRDHHGAASPDGLQVIMDFDLTITAPGSQQCHHMFETSPVLPEDLRDRLAQYLNGQIKVSSREEWWNDVHGLLVSARLTREQVATVARGASVTLREGTAELMLLLRDLGVPLLIASAGISDIIEETLRRHGLLLDNVTIRANTMVFGEDGKLLSFRESRPMHSRNKKETAQRESSYFDSHAARRCVLVVGDKPGDADVSHGVTSEEHCLKIGFFDHSHEHPHPDLPPLPAVTASTTSAGCEGNRVSGEDGNDHVSSVSREHSFSAGLATSLVWGGQEDSDRTLWMAEKGEWASLGQVGESVEIAEVYLAAARMLLTYGDSFDVVARDGHSMGVVTEVVRYLIGQEDGMNQGN